MLLTLHKLKGSFPPYLSLLTTLLLLIVIIS